MFSIKLQINNSEKNKLDKSLTDIITINGTLKEDTSIIDPVILIEGDLNNFVHCNYMTIDTFSRKYFVTNIRSIRNGLIEISCHVDVLSTYKSQIRGNKGIISRQAYNWNLYLNDGSLRCFQNPHVITRTFPSGFNTHELVLAVAGN